MLALGIAGVACACSPDKAPQSEANREPRSTAANPAADSRPTMVAKAGPARASRYSRLDQCRLLRRSAPGEGDFSDHACPGVAGYGIRLSEDDLRQNLWVVPPGGAEHSLKLSEVTHSGGFSRLGETIEWRGAEDGGAFRPDALILRYLVVESADTPEKETSYLLTVSLAGDMPCVTGKLAPGPVQNERARHVADGAMRCLE